MPIPLLERVSEARKRPTVSPTVKDAAVMGRLGYVTGVPMGGATETNPGQSTPGGTIDRHDWMEQLLQAYMTCPWSSACVDVIARSSTAGGIKFVPNQQDPDADPNIQFALPPAVQEVQDLLEYINPYDDIRQLMRGVVTDLLVFGDSFTEVVYLMGKPVALYPLDPDKMYIEADEHGVITGYTQKMDTGRKAHFEPWEVIHVKFDSPANGLYGVSPTQKSILPITVWLFTAALMKETMQRGDPLRAWVDWPIALPEPEMRKFREQYAVRNLGARNIGNLFETKGGATVREMSVNRIDYWLSVLQQRRDEIISSYGVPPALVGVVEAGNIGGGTGTSQQRIFRVNVCGPLQEIILEKFSFHLLYMAYGVTDWHMEFGDVDWRDDMTIEQIADLRLRNGSWCVDDATEILTEEGWTTVDGLSVGSRVLTLNHDKGVSEWQPVKQVATFDVTAEPMMSVETRTHSSLSTLNHRWPVLRPNGNEPGSRRYHYEPAWTTSETMSPRDKIIVGVPHAAPTEAIYDDALVELVAWFWTEGTYEGAPSKFLKIIQHREAGRERIRRALWKTFGAPYEKTHYRPKDGSAGAWIELPDKFRVASPHGEVILTHFEDRSEKVVKTEFLRDLTQEQLGLFLEVSLMGDGVNSHLEEKDGQRLLPQVSRRRAERFQYACILAGVPAHMHMRTKSRESSFSDNDQHVVSLCKTTSLEVMRKDYDAAHVQSYTGRIWCPVTDNKTWLARRNGKVFYTGNTLDRRRASIGEPPVPGGDKALLVDRQNLVLYQDLADLSKANVTAIQAKAAGDSAKASEPPSAPTSPGAGAGTEALRAHWAAYEARRDEIARALCAVEEE